MAALTAERNTPRKDDPKTVEKPWPVKGATTIYKGSLVALNAGYAAPGATATSRVAVGMALETVVNAGADGAKTIRVRQGVHKWANDGGDAIVAGDLGATVYITDDQTVSKTATGKSAAGKVEQIESDGVWVGTFHV